MPAAGAGLLQQTKPARCKLLECIVVTLLHGLFVFESWLLSAALHAKLLFSARYCPSSWASHTLLPTRLHAMELC